MIYTHVLKVRGAGVRSLIHALLQAGRALRSDETSE